MVSLDEKIEALQTMSILNLAENPWAMEWYKNADLSASLALAYGEGMITLTDKGLEVIDQGFAIAHQSLELEPEEFLKILFEAVDELEEEED